MSAAPKQCHYLPCELNDRQILTRTASQLTTARKSDRNINLQLFDSTTCRQRRLQSPQSVSYTHLTLPTNREV